MGSDRMRAGVVLAVWLVLTVAGCSIVDPSPTQTSPVVGVVTCTPAGASVTTPVAVQPDGVHFVVEGPEDVTAIVGDGQGDEPDAWLSGPGQTVSTLLGTGRYQVACRGGATDEMLPVRAPLEIIDPGGIWLEDRLTCPDRVIGITDYVEGAEGERGDLIAAMRRHVTGLRAGDLVTRAGYPVTKNREVRVIRDGRIVAVATYEPAGPDAWLLGSFAVCGSSEISG